MNKQQIIDVANWRIHQQVWQQVCCKVWSQIIAPIDIQFKSHVADQLIERLRVDINYKIGDKIRNESTNQRYYL